jgi:branched-chain amino acid transport system permease protein
MTFFGYAVSDLTRSWLLYQGVLFVLVMMYMPAGITGLARWWSERRAKYSVAELAPAVCTTCLAAVLAAAGSVFTIELAQRIFEEQYRALAAVAGPGSWPPLTAFGRAWSPGSLFTWAIPVVLLSGGALAGRASRSCWQRLEQAKGAEAEASPSSLPESSEGNGDAPVTVSSQVTNKTAEK